MHADLRLENDSFNQDENLQSSFEKEDYIDEDPQYLA
jgi:hypothetical protein